MILKNVFVKYLLTVLVLFSGVAAFAGSDDEDIQKCLDKWEKHPFAKEASKVKYQTLRPGVKIMGIGGKDLNDHEVTKKPALSLVKYSVNVMSKTTMKLMNPKGWYCLSGSTAVLGKAQIELHCKAQLAQVSDSSVGVLGGVDQEGVAVLGSVRVNRKCD